MSRRRFVENKELVLHLDACGTCGLQSFQMTWRMSAVDAAMVGAALLYAAVVVHKKLAGVGGDYADGCSLNLLDKEVVGNRQYLEPLYWIEREVDMNETDDNWVENGHQYHSLGVVEMIGYNAGNKVVVGYSMDG